jgi:hypothetical protein
MTAVKPNPVKIAEGDVLHDLDNNVFSVVSLGHDGTVLQDLDDDSYHTFSFGEFRAAVLDGTLMLGEPDDDDGDDDDDDVDEDDEDED